MTDLFNRDQFYHGTRHPLQIGDLITGNRPTNYGAGQPDPYAYATTNIKSAEEYAHAGYGPEGEPDARPRVYHVEPEGEFSLDEMEAPDVAAYKSKAGWRVKARIL